MENLSQQDSRSDGNNTDDCSSDSEEKNDKPLSRRFNFFRKCARSWKRFRSQGQVSKAVSEKLQKRQNDVNESNKTNKLANSREYTFIRYWVNFSLVSNFIYQLGGTATYLKSDDEL